MVGGDRPKLSETTHHAMLEDMPSIRFGESLCRRASDAGDAVSGVPGAAAHIWIHNQGVSSRNFEERDMDAALLWHWATYTWVTMQVILILTLAVCC